MLNSFLNSFTLAFRRVPLIAVLLSQLIGLGFGHAFIAFFKSCSLKNSTLNIINGVIDAHGYFLSYTGIEYSTFATSIFMNDLQIIQKRIKPCFAINLKIYNVYSQLITHFVTHMSLIGGVVLNRLNAVVNKCNSVGYF